MTKYCEKCGSKLIQGQCPICDEGNKNNSIHKKSNYIWFFILALILGTSVLFNSPMRENLADFFFMNMESRSTRAITKIKSTEYKEASYALLESGADVSLTLEAGNYIVGEDIPEGIYKVTNLFGFGSLWIDDEVNHIYISESLTVEGDESAYYSYYLENVRLYQGAQIRIFTDGMRFESNSGQLDKMVELTPNPLIETYRVDSDILIGSQIPEGTYDIEIIRGEGRVYSEQSWEFGVDADFSEDKDDDYALMRYCNVNLKKDMKLGLDDDMVIRLSPSQYHRMGE